MPCYLSNPTDVAVGLRCENCKIVTTQIIHTINVVVQKNAIININRNVRH